MTHKSKIKNLTISLIIAGIMLAGICPVLAADSVQPSKIISVPTSVEGAKQMGLQALSFFPGIAKNLALETFSWFKHVWQTYVYPFLYKVWQKIVSLFKPEIERRTPIIKEEFPQKTGEVKQELETGIPETAKSIKSLWEKFKELFK
jgi:hypothetical protein